MDTLLTVILVTVALFYLLRIVGGWALRYWIRKKQRQFSQQFGGDGAGGDSRSFGGYSRRGAGDKREKTPEGQVTIHKVKEVEKRVSRNVGDYVEFEEVDVEVESRTETEGKS